MGAAVPRPGARKPRRFRTRQCRPFPAQRTTSSVECYCSRDAAPLSCGSGCRPHILNKAASHTNTEVSHSLAAQIADPWPRQLLSGPLAPPHATRNGSTVSFELRAQQRWWLPSSMTLRNGEGWGGGVASTSNSVWKTILPGNKSTSSRGTVRTTSAPQGG
jgi:hypothetical protein